MEKYKNAYEMYYQNVRSRNGSSKANKRTHIKKINITKITNKVIAQFVLSAMIITLLFILRLIPNADAAIAYKTIRNGMKSNITVNDIKNYDYQNEYQFLKNKTTECMTYLQSLDHQQY